MVRMRIPLAFAVPILLFLGIVLLLAVMPASAAWPQQGFFAYLPYLLLGAAALFGLAFTQTRVTYLAFCMAIAAFLAHFAFFVNPPDRNQGQAILLLATIIASCFIAVFYRLTERGLFTSHGATRSLMLLAALLFLYLLPIIPGFQHAILSSAPPALHTTAGWLRIPGLGVLAFAGALPFLLIGKKGESPSLGPMLAVALLFYLLGLNFQSSLWRESQQQTVFVLFISAAAVMLAGTVLESVWQHMNMDELTGLPGRRPLKHHLRCLEGSYAIAVVDLDHFKHVNDAYGHLVGDQVLRYVATVIAQNTNGKVYRYGGEEFVVIYERGLYEDILKDLEQLRLAVSRKAFALRSAERPARKPRRPQRRLGQSVETIWITISIGAAHSAQQYAAAQEVMDAADQALYQAKTEGRNRVCTVK
jgi:diguanylate cyclase (GGDEF)-like protein